MAAFPPLAPAGVAAEVLIVPGSYRLLLFVIVAGLMLRLVYVLGYPQQSVTFDAEGYDTTAMVFATTGHYPASGRAPVYSTFLAGVYAIFGHSYAAARATQAALVSLTALFAFLVARLSFGDRQGVIAAGIVSFYPGFFAYSGLLLTETLFALLISVFAWCFIQSWRGGGARWAVSAGVMLGLATLCRGEMLALVAPAGALLMWKRRFERGVRDSVLFVVVTVATVTPWVARQYQHRDDGVVLTGGIGATLWLSTYSGDWQEWYADREPLRSLMDCRCPPGELDRRLMAEAARNVFASPGQYVWMSLKRVARFWIGSHSNAIRGLEPSFRAALAEGDAAVLLSKAALLALNLALLATAAAGWYRRRHAPNSWLPLLMIIGYVNLVHTVLFSTSRYQIPIIPMVAVLAACAAVDRPTLIQPKKVT